MVRVLGATGKMYTAAAVVPVVEQRILFNGSTERKIEVARSLEVNPNGLLLLKREDDIGGYNIFVTDVIEYIGNIATEKVREILAFMLVDGFYNFSDWEYQQEGNIKNIKLDNGVSSPYSTAITNVYDFGFIRNPTGKHKFSEDWSFFGELDSDDETVSNCTGNVSDLRQNSYDVEWNTEAFLDDDYDEDIETDEWENWYDEE